jgi:hypothetical protein
MAKFKYLCFEKPKKLRGTKEHNDKYSSDTNIPGTYMPNMRDEDMNKYKAKKILGEYPRLEVRKTVSGTQVLIKAKPYFLIPPHSYRTDEDRSRHKLVNDHGRFNLKISMNGPLELTYQQWYDFVEAVNETIEESKTLPQP